eukprot:6196632-Pleurochrysis_carterae.AAC.1
MGRHHVGAPNFCFGSILLWQRPSACSVFLSPRSAPAHAHRRPVTCATGLATRRATERATRRVEALAARAARLSRSAGSKRVRAWCVGVASVVSRESGDGERRRHYRMEMRPRAHFVSEARRGREEEERDLRLRQRSLVQSLPMQDRPMHPAARPQLIRTTASRALELKNAAPTCL